MYVTIANRSQLKKFLIKYIGQILPTTEAKFFKNKLECIAITDTIYDKIMMQWKKVVEKKEKLKKEGGSRFRKKRTKKKRKSSKRRTRKNQKGGDPFTLIAYSVSFFTLLGIALPIIMMPFITVKDCIKRNQDRIRQENRLLNQRKREAEREKRSAAEASELRRRTRNNERSGDRGFLRRKGFLYKGTMTPEERSKRRFRDAKEAGEVEDLTGDP